MRASRATALASSLVLGLACATGSGPSRPSSATGAADLCPEAPDGRRDPGALVARADAALELRNEPGAYGCLALVRILHPESPQARDLFARAATLYKRNYFRHRLVRPEPFWITTEPAFMFGWLATFADGDRFPQEQAEALLLQMPTAFAGSFEEWSREHPVFARWRFELPDDNGLIVQVIATPVGATAADAAD